jgi:hypothetical protein
MVFSIIYGVATENARDLAALDRILAGIVGSIIVIGFNFVIFKLLSKIWK